MEQTKLRLQQLLSKVRKAVDDHHMIQEGDMAAIGLSGGKDSMTLLYAMKKLSAFYPHHFQVIAISIDLGFYNQDFTAMEDYCKMLEVPFHVVHTQIAEIVFDEKKEESPCSLCSRLRKGAFNKAAAELGCNKTAFAHHKDDAVETMMMSLLLEGRIHTFSPVTKLDRTGLTLIRPLLYVNEADVLGFVHKYQIPVLKNPCPADGITNRQYIKELLRKINQDMPGVKDRIFTAINNSIYNTSSSL